MLIEFNKLIEILNDFLSSNSNYTRNANISDNYIAFAGDNGIAVVGHSKLIDGTNGNQPRGTKILRNVIHDTGVWGKGVRSISLSIYEEIVKRF